LAVRDRGLEERWKKRLGKKRKGKAMSQTIMTVDDSSSMRRMIRFTLQQEGYHVMEAANGEEALSKVRESPVSLFLVDINMPGMDGIRLVRELRNDPRHRFTPVIVLTTEGRESWKEKGKEARATGWIVKPFRPEELLEVARKLLGGPSPN